MRKLFSENISKNKKKSNSISKVKHTLNTNTLSAILLLLITASFLLSGCSNLNYYQDIIDDDYTLRQFSSEDEINSFLLRHSSESNDLMLETTNLRVGNQIAMDSVAPTAESIQEFGSVEGSSGDSGDISYSETNVQVQGVDEADIVKTDGDYIFYVSDNNLYIIEILDDNTMIEIVKLNYDEHYIRDILFSDNRLVVIGNSYNSPSLRGDSRNIPQIGILPYYPYFGSNTFISIYDISDRSNPDKLEFIEAEGSYTSSRLINKNLFVITDKRLGDTFFPPIIMRGDDLLEISASDIYYSNTEDESYDLSLVMKINIEDASLEKLPILKGSTNEVYVSNKNIYLAGRKNVPYISEQLRIINEVYKEILPNDIVSRINQIESYDLRLNTKISEINHEVYRYLSSLELGDAETLYEKINEMTSVIREEIRDQRDHTVLHRISIEDGLSYEASGIVRGHINNQFSMDEYNEYFRIATTSGSFWDSNNPSLNNVFVLNMDLDVVGDVTGLAPEERIHSVRFMGDTMHMVTFRTVDPLFSINLSNPQNPFVEGELKLPGYSDYLHPIGKNHLIGVGRDVVEISEDVTVDAGVKLSLFDISNLENPVEISNYIIGGRGSYTPALNDHKSFLFDRQSGLLIIPIREYEKTNLEERNGRMMLPFGNQIHQGAYIFEIVVEGDISLKGRITHVEESSEDDFRYRTYGYDILRSLIINDTLFSLSLRKVASHDLDSLNLINDLTLSRDKEDYGVRHVVDYDSEMVISS